jgi:hypothetical protein
MSYPHRCLLAILIALLALVPAGIASARQTNLSIDIQPETGPPGATVTITGQGAPPNAAVRVLFAPFDDVAACRAGRDAETVATVNADASGRFIAAHVARRQSPSQAGNTYLTKLDQGPAPRPDSNLECFTFSQAQDARFFPATGHTVSGTFLDFWQRHGGLAIFGYPLTDRQQENGREVQYFERQRFELHPEHAPPYNVLLGRLGAELLKRRGINWQTDIASSQANPACLWFGQTRHNVCDQGRGAGFRSYWTRHGLEFDRRPGASFAESLALFGYPLTEAYIETNSSGDTVLTQWFERARFEWHPNNPSAYRVLLGRLGAELLQARGEQPQPPTFSQVKLYFIALGDQGRSGPQIGCGDSAVPVEISIEPTTAPLTAAIQRLLAIDSQYYGQSGLYNALYRSDLRFESAVVEQGQATIRLSGDLQLGGVCDDPRVEAQLKETAKQFSTVDEVVVYLNGQRLEDVLSGR